MRVTLVGLGELGCAVGSALKASAKETQVMGHDPERERVKVARRARAIDRSHWNLIAACEGADVVWVDLPLGETLDTLRILSSELEGQTLIVDNCPCKASMARELEAFARRDVEIIGGHLVPESLVSENSSLMNLGEALLLLVPTVETPQWAIERALWLAENLGAEGVFTSAAEHDGLVAATEQLPALAGAALRGALAHEPGGEDRARCSGPALDLFDAMSALTSVGVDELLANRDNVLHWLAAYGARLRLVEEALRDGDARALSRALVSPGEPVGAPDGNAIGEIARSPWRDLFLGQLGQRR